MNGFTQVIASALFFKDALVDLTCGEIVGSAHSRGDEALVVSQIQVGLCTIFGDKDLTVLKRGHCARIHIDVRIKFNESDFEATRFKNRSEGG